MSYHDPFRSFNDQYYPLPPTALWDNSQAAQFTSTPSTQDAQELPTDGLLPELTDTYPMTMDLSALQWQTPPAPVNASAQDPFTSYAPFEDPHTIDYNQLFYEPSADFSVGHHAQNGDLPTWPADALYPILAATSPFLAGLQQPALHASPVMSNHSDETLVNSPPATSPGSASDTVFAASPKPIGEHDLQVHQGPRANQSPRSGPLALFEHTRQLDFFNEANALNMRDGGPIVPQRMYMPTTRADRRRYVEAVGLQPPIHFLRTDGDYGIPLSTALRRSTSELADPSQRVFDGVQPSVSIRLEWPGYRSWTRQIPTKDFRKVQMPITREKLAKEIAKCVQRFISERQQHPIIGDAQLRAWRIGDRGIKLEDLVLVSMHHVSRGSWQPQLRLRAPRTF